MLQHIQFRTGLATHRTSITPLKGEALWDHDTKELFVGDGITQGGIQIAGPSITTTLHGNVVCTPPIANGDILMYDSSGPYWKNIKLELKILDDFNLGSASNNQMLKYDSSIQKWINFTPSFSHTDLVDFNLTGAMNGDILVYNSSSNTWNRSPRINIRDNIDYNVNAGYKHIFRINNIEVASVDQYGLAGAHYNADYAETFLTELTELPLEGTPVGLNDNGRVITLKNEEVGTSNFIGLISYHPGHLLGDRHSTGWDDTLKNLKRLPVALFGQVLVDIDIEEGNVDLIIGEYGKLIKKEKYHQPSVTVVAKTLYPKNGKMLVLIRGGF
jgi:hypothetical protein